MSQYLSGNAVVRQLFSGGLIPAGCFAPAAGASALGENPTFLTLAVFCGCSGASAPNFSG